MFLLEEGGKEWKKRQMGREKERGFQEFEKKKKTDVIITMLWSCTGNDLTQEQQHHHY